MSTSTITPSTNLRAFEFTYVDLDKDNKQRRLKRLIKAENQKQAVVLWDTWKQTEFDAGKRWHLIGKPSEVDTKIKAGMLENLFPVNHGKKIKHRPDPAIVARNQELRALAQQDRNLAAA